MRKTAAVVAIVLAGLGASGTAFAGESGGSGKPGNDPRAPEHANSICAFSGLEDGSEPGSVAGPGNTQNWGQIPQDVRVFLTSIGENPGTACNGHLFPWQDVVGG